MRITHLSFLVLFSSLLLSILWVLVHGLLQTPNYFFGKEICGILLQFASLHHLFSQFFRQFLSPLAGRARGFLSLKRVPVGLLMTDPNNSLSGPALENIPVCSFPIYWQSKENLTVSLIQSNWLYQSCIVVLLDSANWLFSIKVHDRLSGTSLGSLHSKYRKWVFSVCL